MDLIKIKDKKTGAVIEVKNVLASDYIGTGRFEIFKEDKKKPVENKNDKDK